MVISVSRPACEDPRDFERAVADLLTVAGYQVKREVLLGYKKVDLYLEERLFSSKRRIAVECKCYQQRLRQDELTEIYANYRPLYESNLIDEILVITRNGLAPSAQAMVDHARELTHLTLTDLQCMIMDFQSYLTGLVNQFHEGGLSSYYVPLRASQGENLVAVVLRWIGEETLQPLAILGGYGMGKTTFARRLSHLLASRHFAERTRRIPILLRLGEISAEQSLEGLLGKALTATAVVRSYSFATFMALNQAGRFVIILDGFDEMKHTLTWDEFRFNFRQLNRLVVPKGKVILLGRPNAFMSDEEHNYALHGIQNLDGMELRDPEWPDYREIYLSPFARRQVERFLRLYFKHKEKALNSEREKKHLRDMLAIHIDQITGKALSDIARRPVQLKMIADILPQWKRDLSKLTVAILYSHFIDLIIDRDIEKAARRRFRKTERRQFATEIAWWLWNTKREMSISGEDIPQHIIESYAYPGESMDGVRRDLVSACFLEKKIGGALYFPHRSFQEFLVADAINEGLSNGRISFQAADSALTEDVSGFLEGMVNVSNFMKWESHLSRYRGMLSWRMVRMFVSEDRFVDYFLDRISHSMIPWYALALTIGISKRLLNRPSAEDYAKRLVGQIESSHDPMYSVLAFFCSVGISGLVGHSSSRPVANMVGPALAALCRTRYPKAPSSREQDANPDPSVRYLLSTIQIGRKRSGPPGAAHAVNLAGTYPVLCEMLSQYCLISDWVAGKTIRTSDISTPAQIYTWNIDEFSELERFQERYCPRHEAR